MFKFECLYVFYLLTFMFKIECLYVFLLINIYVQD